MEARTSAGRVNTVMRTKDTLCLIELKLNKSAETAMRQVDVKDCAARFALCDLPTVKVVIDFGSGKRALADWTIEKQ